MVGGSVMKHVILQNKIEISPEVGYLCRGKLVVRYVGFSRHAFVKRDEDSRWEISVTQRNKVIVLLLDA